LRIARKTDSAWLESFVDCEDVHHFVEKALVEELGPLGLEIAYWAKAATTRRHRFPTIRIDAAGTNPTHALEAMLNRVLLQAKANRNVPMRA